MNEKEDLKRESESADEVSTAPIQKAKLTRPQVMRRIVAPIFAVLAVASIVAAILSLTVLKPSRFVTAQAQVSTPYVVTGTGVANLVSGSLEVTAQAQDDVCVVLASAVDAQAWLKAQSTRYSTVSGLKNWTTLNVSDVQRTSTSKKSVAFKDSDLWQEVKCAKKTATLSLSDVTASQQVIAYSEDGVTSVRMRWVRPEGSEYNQATPWFAAMAVFIVCALLSATWLASNDPLGIEHRKIQKAAQEEAARLAQLNGEEIASDEYQPYQKKSKTGITHRSGRKGLIGKLFGSKKKDAAPSEAVESTPRVIDPSSVNLVASTGAGATDTSWSPSFINITNAHVESDTATTEKQDLTGEELLEYLARLAIQDRADNAANSANADNQEDNGNEQE